jgi:DNA-binding NarL/FixJ family response regulator
MTHKIVIADRHPVVHRGIRHAFADEPEFQIAGTTTKVTQIQATLTTFEPDLIITESRFEDQDAFKVLEPIMCENKALVVIVFSQHEDSIHIARAGALGCYEYIPKTSSCSELVKAAKDGINGIPTDADSLMGRIKIRITAKRPNTDRAIPLTQREMQVLRHIAMGMKNREIGMSLKISVETVKEHVQNILRKLSVNDRTQAAVTAVKNGWI